MNQNDLEQLVREFLRQKLKPTVRKAAPVEYFSQADRLDTKNPADRVFTHDLFSVEESPRLGAGWMEMTKSEFAWHLDYDEMDYIVQGTLKIITDQGTVTGKEGDVLLIPKGSDIRFSAPEYAKFLYFTYPADWKNSDG